MEVTYDNIKSLIQSEILEGQQVTIKFKAHNQDHAIETIGIVMPDQDEIMKMALKNAAMQGAANMAVGSASNALGAMLGGAAGSMVSGAINSAGAQATAGMFDPSALLKTEVTPEKQQTAVLNAFIGLQNFYKFNPELNIWEYTGN